MAPQLCGGSYHFNIKQKETWKWKQIEISQPKRWPHQEELQPAVATQVTTTTGIQTCCNIYKAGVAGEVIEFWSFIPLFVFFNMSMSGFQDACAQVTEGFVLRI